MNGSDQNDRDSIPLLLWLRSKECFSKGRPEEKREPLTAIESAAFQNDTIDFVKVQWTLGSA